MMCKKNYLIWYYVCIKWEKKNIGFVCIFGGMN